MIGGRKTYKGGKFNRPEVDNPVVDAENGTSESGSGVLGRLSIDF